MHVQGQNREQATLFPDRLDDLIGEYNALGVIDAFVDSLDLKALGFARIEIRATSRTPYHPGDLLKLYVHGYMHWVRSSRRLACISVLGLICIDIGSGQQGCCRWRCLLWA